MRIPSPWMGEGRGEGDSPKVGPDPRRYNMRLDGAQVVIVGAGVTGLSAAWWLAKNGVDTIVVEKGVIGAEASSRNGGDISHRAYEPPVVPLAAESLKLWPEMAGELGYPTEYSPGSLHVAMDDEEAEWMKQSNVDWGEKFDIPFQWWDGDAVKDAVPMVAPETPGAQFAPTDGHANPQRTVQAYAWGFLDRGAGFTSTPPSPASGRKAARW